jgi:Tfp pilus assembly protein PilO
MTARDRIVVSVLAAAVAIGGFWVLMLGPKRNEASKLATQIAAARAQLDTARQQAQTAAEPPSALASDFATIARAGKAIPAQPEMPSLLYQLESTARSSHIDFTKLDVQAQQPGAAPSQPASSGTGSTTSGGPSASSSAAGQAKAPPAPAFQSLPFSLTFKGSFFTLSDFLKRLDDFVSVRGGQLAVTGRLLSIDGIALSAAPEGFPHMEASVAAEAYMLPSAQAAPAAAAPGAAGSTPTSSASSGSTPPATASASQPATATIALR